MTPRPQYAALPYRRTADGAFEVLLVTSRETLRWIIPKGWPMKGRTPSATAAREALEEAGVVGRISKKPLGVYTYDKRLKSGDAVPCAVEVFPLEVRAQRKNWPEKDARSVGWFSPRQAERSVGEPELKKLIRRLRSVLAA
jgi:8-oxo-dGTP pyrophosphatase MutT (NUDIX family)